MAVKLEVGQKVFMGRKRYEMLGGDCTPTLYPAEVVAANGSSAYVVLAEALHKDHPFKHRICQRTHKVLNNSISRTIHNTLWLSEDAYLQAQDHAKQYSTALSEAQAIVAKLSLEDLEAFIATYKK